MPYYKDQPIIVHAENCTDGTNNWLDDNYLKYDIEYHIDSNDDPKGNWWWYEFLC